MGRLEWHSSEEGSIVEIDVDDTGATNSAAAGPRHSLEVALPPGLAVKGMVLAQQVRTIDLAARNAALLAVTPRPILLAVRARLKAVLAL